MGADSDGPSPGEPAPGAGDLGEGVFLAAMEASPTPMVLSDPNRRDEPIVYANPAFLRLTGYGRSEVIGRNCRFLQGPDTDQAAVDEIRGALRGRAEIAAELLNYRKDGTPFWNALSISPVFDRSGALAFFCASQLDVTRRREAEDALRRAEVAAPPPGLAHEFNNLFQIITGHIQGIKGSAARSGDARLILQAGAVSEAADRALALARQLSAAPRAPDPPGASSPKPEIRGAAERILVVDDRIEVAELARTMLEEAGYAVEVARDGRDALARLERGFDLLFTDLVMPGEFDGAALAREARRRRPGLRVLLTTGQAEGALGSEFSTIAKPYRRSELAKAIRAALGGPADGR